MADKCPKCSHSRVRVLDTRGIERRRECGQCGFRYITRETFFAAVSQRNTTASNRSARK